MAINIKELQEILAAMPATQNLMLVGRHPDCLFKEEKIDMSRLISDIKKIENQIDEL
ncbi:MAG: hypothetical protein K6A41_07720 [Bacteroidales bacterium]|nr:hypothetical protein [Bacteroidales bacterium]